MNPLPDCSNYSPLCHTHYLTPDQYFIVSSGQTLYHASWRLILQSSLLQRFTAESSQGTQCLEEAEQQAEASVDVLLKFLIHFPFVSFSLSLSSLYSLSQSSLFSLSPIPSFSSDQFLVLIQTSSLITFCFTNGTFFFGILFHTMTYFF